MKKLLMITLLLSNLIGVGFATEKIETYEDLVNKEKKMRELEKENFEKESADTYEADRKAEEAAEKKELEREEKTRKSEREPRHIEVKDDAGYDKNNMDKIREKDHRAWNKLHDGFDQPNK